MKLRATLVAALLLSCISAFAADPTPKVRTEMLVSTTWLAEHLNDPNVVILHIGSDRAAYDAGHIPGARFLATKEFIKSDPPGSELPAPDFLQKAFAAVGVTAKSRVILYAQDWQPMAARAWFTLDYMGHGDHAALLNGGFEKWMIEKREVSKETPAFVPTDPAALPLKLRPETLIARAEVAKLSAENAAAFLDARPLSRYRMGHIPGAESVFWEKMLVSDADPVLKAPEELRKLLAHAGAAPNRKNVAYCEVGLQASFAYFVTKYLGLDAVNYDGSFADWSKAEEPIVRGDSPR
jgi:thiosulfate/3-mercaptopyruvate sulfurtransferase